MGAKLDAVLAKGLPDRDKRNANRVNLWAFGWMLSLMGNMIPTKIFDQGAELLWAAIFAVHVLCGVMLVLSYRRFLSQLDEMERKVQLEALALAVGFSILVYSAGSILASVGVLWKPDASIMLAVMSLTYMGGLIVGRIRLA